MADDKVIPVKVCMSYVGLITRELKRGTGTSYARKNFKLDSWSLGAGSNHQLIKFEEKRFGLPKKICKYENER